jgi:hypothetical protein
MAGRLLATLVVLAMLLTGPAAAQSIRLDGETATLVGDIEEDLPDRIASLPEDVRILVLTSVGGYTEAAFDAAKDIRVRGLTTYVPEFCFSACTMLFQAGVRRIIGVKGSLMFHPSRPPNAEFDYWVGRIYIRYGLDPKFVERFNAGGEHTLAPDQAIAVGAATQIGAP